MLRNIFTALMLAASFAHQGAELEVRITSYPKELPLGAPLFIAAEVRNVSGKPLPLANGSDGYRRYTTVRRTDGKPVDKLCDPSFSHKTAGTDAVNEVPPDWQQKELINHHDCTKLPGELIIQFIAESKGPYSKYDTQTGAVIGEFTAWKGTVKSEEVHVIIREPRGEDKKAYEELQGAPMSHRGKLFNRYPKTIYAAYAWQSNTITDNSNMEPKLFLAKVRESGFLHGKVKTDDNEKPIPNGKGDYESLSADEVQQHVITQAQLTLKHHPDFQFADQLKMRIAQAYIALRQEQKAKPYFQAVAEIGESPELCERAKQYLELLLLSR